MSDAVEYADDCPEPRKSCPSVRVIPTLTVTVFGVQALFVVALRVAGVGLVTAELVAISLFVVDMLALTARPARLWSALLRAILPAMMRCVAGASVPPWTSSDGM